MIGRHTAEVNSCCGLYAGLQFVPDELLDELVEADAQRFGRFFNLVPEGL